MNPSKPRIKSGSLLAGILIGLALAIGPTLILIPIVGSPFDWGVIAAARGTHVAELVEQEDGTTEWKVREVGE